MGKPWYIDRGVNVSSIFKKDYYQKLTVSTGAKTANDMIAYLGLPTSGNPNAVLTYLRDLGLLRMDNDLTNFFKICIESKISNQMITLLIMMRRNCFKDEANTMKPFVVMAKALNIMHEMGYEKTLTWTICANYLMKIDKYSDIDEEILAKAVADTSEANSMSVLDIWFNALIYTGLFEGSAQKITLRPEYVDFIKFIADYGQDIPVCASKEDYASQLNDAKHGIYSIASKHPFEAIAGLSKLPEISAYLKTVNTYDNAKDIEAIQLNITDVMVSKEESSLTVNELGAILSDMYNNADGGSKVSSIHVFGIKYGRIIREKDFKASEIIRASGINESYATELHKGLSSFDSINGNKYGVGFARPNNIGVSTEEKEDEITHAWFVGATGHDEEGNWTDFSEQYISEGRWENGWDDKFIDEVKSMKTGDRIVVKSAYTKKKGLPFNNNGKTVGVMGIKAIGIITDNLGDGKNIKVAWTAVDPIKEWYGAGVLRQTVHFVSADDGLIRKSLLKFVFDSEPQDYSICEEQYGDVVPDDVVLKKCSPYTKKDFLNDVFCSDSEYETLKQLLSYKKNVILQGSPGVGKTFLAKRLAYSLMGEEDTSRVEVIQFHQNYSYEDFIMGYKPYGEGFSLQTGVFYDFCKKAQDDDKPYYFIIDEINRGNVSKIFGELMMLIENDKRGKESVKLAYKNEMFTIPENLYIIGMMNTADRSLAIMDYALRRRFSFIEIEPAFEKNSFEAHLITNGLSNEMVNKIITNFKALNEFIADEKNSGLGAGFRIGHSYFCSEPNCNETVWYNNIIRFEIAPLLEEYWFDEKDKVTDWMGRIK